MGWLLTLLIACGGKKWSSAEDCADLDAGKDRDDCWVEHLLPDYFKADTARGEAIIRDQVTDPAMKDFLWYQATQKINPSSYAYCENIENDLIEQRCRQFVARPHMHSELLQGGDGQHVPPSGRPGTGGAPGGGRGAPGGPGGGPPGGGSPPGNTNGPGGAPGPGSMPGGGGSPPPGGQPPPPGG